MKKKLRHAFGYFFGLSIFLVCLGLTIAVCSMPSTLPLMIELLIKIAFAIGMFAFFCFCIFIGIPWEEIFENE